MQSWDKNISAQLNNARSNKATIPTRGVSNCIILERNGLKTYSYFQFTEDRGYIDHCLVTLAHHQKGNQAQVHRSSANLESQYKQKFAGIKQIEVAINSHFTLPLYLVVFTYRFKDRFQSRLVLLELDPEAIVSGEMSEITLLEINLSKQVLKAEWHPHYQEYFVVLTTQEIRVYSTQNDNDSQLDFPCFNYKFRDLKIGQSIVDFQFWQGSGEYSRLLMVALSEVGRVFLLLCVLEPRSLTEQEQQFLMINSKISNDNNQYGFMVSWCSLPQQKMKNAHSLKVIHSGPVTLLVKTSDVKEGTKTSFLQISSLQESHYQFTERELICIRDDTIKDEYSQFEMESQLIDNSLYFVYRNKLIRLDLDSQLKFISQVGKHRNYGLPALKIDTVLDFQQSKLVFLQFERNYIRLLRKGPTVSEFNSFPLLSIELNCSRKEIDQKLSKLFNNMDQLIHDAQREYDPNCETQIGNLQDFKEENNEKEVMASCQAAQAYIVKVQESLKQSNEEVNRLFDEVMTISKTFDIKNKRKKDLQTLLQSIQDNSVYIGNLISKQGPKEGQDKIEYLQNMIDFINSKKLDLQRDDEEQFMAVAESHLEALEKTKEKLQKCQERLMDA